MKKFESKTSLETMAELYRRNHFNAQRGLIWSVLGISALASVSARVANFLGNGGHGLLFIIAIVAFETILSGERKSNKSSGSRLLTANDMVEELKKLSTRKNLEIDAFAYTAETVYHILSAFLKALEESPHPVRRVSIRLLVRDFSRSSAIPCSDILDDDYEYRRKNVEHHLHCMEMFRGLFADKVEELRSDGIDVKLSVRAYVVDPFMKGFIIDRRAFWALYPIAKPRDAKIWDYSGVNVRYCELTNENDRPEGEKETFRFIQDWFRQMWKDPFSKKCLSLESNQRENSSAFGV